MQPEAAPHDSDSTRLCCFPHPLSFQIPKVYPKLTDAHVVVVVVMVVVVVEGSHDPDLKHAVKAAAYLTQSLFVFDAV